MKTKDEKKEIKKADLLKEKAIKDKKIIRK